MRELKQLEMLIAKAESGTGRGSPSAMSVERLNGLKERFGMVRGRVERRVYEGASLIFFCFGHGAEPPHAQIPPPNLKHRPNSPFQVSMARQLSTLCILPL
jgi:hypothetical protein